MAAGLLRQQLVLLLPVNEKEADFNSTEPIDYPCSLQKVCVLAYPVPRDPKCLLL